MKQRYLSLFILFLPLISSARFKTADNDSTKTCFLRIDGRKWQDFDPSFFFLRFDEGSVHWESPALRPIDKDTIGYLVKVSIPLKVLALNPMFRCDARGYPRILPPPAGAPPAGAPAGGAPPAGLPKGGIMNAMRSLSYEGVFANNIQLSVKSVPSNADIYLIPNRIWKSKIKDKWESDKSVLEDFLVAADKTDVVIDIPETVFVIIFSLNGKFEWRLFPTQPKADRPKQSVTVHF